MVGERGDLKEAEGSALLGPGLVSFVKVLFAVVEDEVSSAVEDHGGIVEILGVFFCVAADDVGVEAARKGATESEGGAIALGLKEGVNVLLFGVVVAG